MLFVIASSQPASCVQAGCVLAQGHGVLKRLRHIASTGKDATCAQAGRGSNPRAHRRRPRFMVVSMCPGRGVRPDVCMCACV